MTKVTKKIKTAKQIAKKINKKIDADNAAFQKMSPAQKRVAIAQDVLKHLRTRKINPRTGIYCAPDSTSKSTDKLIGKSAEDTQVQEIYANVKSCDVCALGAMFFCTVKVADKLKLSEMRDGSFYNDFNDDLIEGVANDVGYADGDDVYAYMKRYFSVQQLRLIETAFEQDATMHRDNNKNFDAAELLEDEDSPAKRMRAIMENIVKNKGKFVVPKRNPEAEAAY